MLVGQSATKPLKSLDYEEGSETMYAEPVRRSANWTRENLAWMAGLFEGEGYVQGRPRSYKRADGRTFTTVGFRLAISMTDEDVIRRFHQLAGVGTCNGPRLSPSMKNQPLWDYRAHGADAYALTVAMWPSLGMRRKSQLQTSVLAWIASPGHWRRRKASASTG